MEDHTTSRQRLARSRQALVEQWAGSTAPPADQAGAAAGAPRPRSAPARAGLLANLSWGAVARLAAQRWWRRHPANAAAHLARPMLVRLAHEQPGKVVAAAAAAGALLVIVRPWRLLSATALATLLFKSSDIADLVTTLLDRPRKRSDAP